MNFSRTGFSLSHFRATSESEPDRLNPASPAGRPIPLRGLPA